MLLAPIRTGTVKPEACFLFSWLSDVNNSNGDKEDCWEKKIKNHIIYYTGLYGGVNLLISEKYISVYFNTPPAHPKNEQTNKNTRKKKHTLKGSGKKKGTVGGDWKP